MSITEKYINPFTDFGFKKLFGTELNKDLLIDFLNQVLPEKHQIQDLTYARTEHLGNSEADRKFSLDDKVKYEESLKYYRDLKNVVDTSYEEGKAEGKEERNIEIARQMKSDGESLDKIIRYTGLSAQDIENI